MSIRREEQVRGALEACLAELSGREEPYRGDPRIPREAALACLEAAFKSRLLDLMARELKDRGEGFYTIGSAGHEGNAVLGHLLRPTDPCLLHYRSGAFMAARCQRQGGETFLWDTLCSLVASREDPSAGGRHKVWGSRRLWVPPQTSTIASHLPKALGLAFSLERRRRLGLKGETPEDGIVCASFGDASVNHASAATAFNACSWVAAQNLPLPLLLVCEDNGVGISVHAPEDFIPSVFRNRPGFAYFVADGCDLPEAFEVSRKAMDLCRRRRRPVFLHLKLVRLMGHAGSDVETLYHSDDEIEANEARDPLLRMSRWAVAGGYVSGGRLRELYQDLEARIHRIAARVVGRPKLETLAEIVEPLCPPPWRVIRGMAGSAPPEEERRRLHGPRLPEEDRPRHMAMQLNRALVDLMLQHPEMILFGEDVARKGGVYHVTAGLFEKFGGGRVFNTLLDETTILGLGMGAAQAGLLPVPEIQYLAYLHNAEDQLRGEACSQRFFSGGDWDNPMVVRIASLAYQKGFGGHFHNDNSLGVLRDVPGLILALPSRGDDAVGMLRTCVAAAKAGRGVCAFLEPIALYMQKDLHEEGDGAWATPYPPPGRAVPLGEPRRYESSKGPEILLVTYGNGVPMALRVRRRLGLEERVEILDLRWLAPLPSEVFLERAGEAGAVLVLDECRRTGGGISETLAALLAEDPRRRGLPFLRVTAADSYVPLGKAAERVLPSERDLGAALQALEGGRG